MCVVKILNVHFLIPIQLLFQQPWENLPTIECVGGDIQEDLTTSWPVGWIRAMRPCAWSARSPTIPTVGAVSKDTALREYVLLRLSRWYT